MATMTRDGLHALVEALADEDIAVAGRVLTALVDDGGPVTAEAEEHRNAESPTAEAAARDVPGVMSGESLRGDFWPAEEAEAIVATIDRWRREDGNA